MHALLALHPASPADLEQEPSVSILHNRDITYLPPGEPEVSCPCLPRALLLLLLGHLPSQCSWVQMHRTLALPATWHCPFSLQGLLVDIAAATSNVSMLCTLVHKVRARPPSLPLPRLLTPH